MEKLFVYTFIYIDIMYLLLNNICKFSILLSLFDIAQLFLTIVTPNR